MLLLAIENANAGRAVHLMAAENVEITIEALYINFQVRDRLGAVDQDGNAVAVRSFDDALHWIDRAQRIGDVDDRHQLGARAEQLLVPLEREFAVVVDGHDAQLRSLLFAQDLPGHDVGVVLHVRDDDLIAGTDVGTAKGLGYEVDSFGCAAREDNFLRLRRVEKALYLGPSFLVFAGGKLAEEMHGAMNVRVVMLVEAADGVDDAARLLRRGGVVEIHKRMAVYRPVQNREIIPDLLQIEQRRQRLAVRPRLGFDSGK